MTIGTIESWRLDMRLSEPYTIAYESFDRTVNILLRITDAAGERGIGCAAPAPEVTGETDRDCHEALREAAANLVCSPTEPHAIATRAAALSAESTPAACAALDIAAHDLLARRRGEPLWKSLGGTLRPLPTSITLGIAPLAQVVASAQRHVDGGFTALKVKGGADLRDDIESLRTLRRQLGADIELRFDANQGYSVEETVAFAAATAGVRVSMIEQPLPAGGADSWARLRDRLAEVVGSDAPPLMADESLRGVRDAHRLAATAAVQAFNVKLMKCGGIGPATQIGEIAAAAGIPVMLSCMDESAVSIAAALHLALAMPVVRWIDLDGHLDLIDDPAADAVRLDAGALLPAPGAGLGVSLPY